MMKFADILMLIAVLVAPIAAVQVQKSLEVFREVRGRRLRIFKTLMATRAATVSPDHVQALNMIDLEFHDKQFKAVTTSWKTYLDHLSSFPKDNPDQQSHWDIRRVDLLTALLIEMGRSLGYEFDEVHVKKGIYAPEAHGRIDHENSLIRSGLVRLLYGDGALKLDVKSLPSSSDEDRAASVALRDALTQLLTGNGALPVNVNRVLQDK